MGDQRVLGTIADLGAVGQGRRSYWFAIGVETGLLLLTTYAGFVLIGLLLAFTLATRRGRDQFNSFEPFAAGAVVFVVLSLVVRRVMVERPMVVERAPAVEEG